MHYHRVAKLLHWGMALCIIGMIVLGIYMNQISPASLRIHAYQFHKSLGITILFLTLFRIYWRLTHPAPALPAEMKPLEKFAAHSAHVALYVLMFAMPFSGWLLVSALAKYPTIFFWMFEMPFLPIPEFVDAKALRHLAGTVHEFSTQWVAIPLISFHVLAALYHHFIRKDTVLTRMLPQRFSRRV